MASRYWVGGTGNWSDYTNHWAATSGGAPGASLPTSTDDVYFDANSFSAAGQTVTVDVGANCNNMDWTGATNNPNLTIGGSGLLNSNIYGNATFIAGMTTNSTNGNHFLCFVTGTHTLTTNGVTFVFNIKFTSDGTTTIADSCAIRFFHCTGHTLNAGAITINDMAIFRAIEGTNYFNFNNTTINITTAYFGLNFASNPTITGAHTINLSSVSYFYGGATTTFDTINLNGTSHSVTGSFTCVNLTRQGTATKTDSVTFAAGSTITVTGTLKLAGNSATNRLLVKSSTTGTAATISAATMSADTNNVDFMDITGTGAASWDLSARSAGDCGGNTGITFTAASSQTSSKASNWSDSTMWTSRVPLPQDDVTCSHNVTIDMPCIGKSITFSGTPAVTVGINFTNYGSFTLVSGMTYTPSTYTHTLAGRGSYTLTSAGKSRYNVTLTAPGGTYTLQDAMTVTNVFTMTAGTLASNGQTITLSATGAITKWSATGGTYSGTGTIVLTSSLNNAQTFAGGSLTYNNVTVQGAGNYTLTISGSNTFNTLTVDRSEAAKTIAFTDGTTQTVTNFICAQSGTTFVTLTGTGTAGWTITKAGGGIITLDYLAISYSTASPASTWYAGEHSYIAAGTVSGWVFGNPSGRSKFYVVPMLF